MIPPPLLKKTRIFFSQGVFLMLRILGALRRGKEAAG
jgi:hypothetical protein